MIIEPLRNSGINALNRVRTRWETARLTLLGESKLPYKIHFLPRLAGSAEALVAFYLRELPRGWSVGFMLGVEDAPGLPLSPLSSWDTQAAWDRFEEVVKQRRLPYRIVRTAYALVPGCDGDRVYVTRPPDTLPRMWRGEDPPEEEEEDEADDDLDDEDNEDLDEDDEEDADRDDDDDDDEEAADEKEVEEQNEPVEPVFVLLLEVTALATSA